MLYSCADQCCNFYLACSHNVQTLRACLGLQLLLQVGTAVVTRQDKRLAVGRLGALVEQIEALVSKDLQVILVIPQISPFGCTRCP